MCMFGCPRPRASPMFSYYASRQWLGLSVAHRRALSTAVLSLHLDPPPPPTARKTTKASHPLRGERHRGTTLFRCAATAQPRRRPAHGQRAEHQGHITGPTRSSLLWRSTPRDFSPQLGSHIPRGCGAAFSPATALCRHVPSAYSSSSAPFSLCGCHAAGAHRAPSPLPSLLVPPVRLISRPAPNKNALGSREPRAERLSRSACAVDILPHLANHVRRSLHPARDDAGGLPGFFGPFSLSHS